MSHISRSRPVTAYALARGRAMSSSQRAGGTDAKAVQRVLPSAQQLGRPHLSKGLFIADNDSYSLIPPTARDRGSKEIEPAQVSVTVRTTAN